MRMNERKVTIARIALWCVVALTAGLPSWALAQEPAAPATPAAAAPAAPAAAPVPTTDEKIAAATLAGDNAWMLTSCALVLFMTAPGLALFYGGLVRRKNVLGVIMQCLFLMGMNTVLWGLYGYSLAFGGTTGAKAEDSPWYQSYIGSGEFLLMRNVGPTWDESAKKPVYPLEEPVVGRKIPRLTHMLFQGMFFIITPALICGAFAERMKFSAMVVFSLLWGALVYCPLCHWVWDYGILAYGARDALAGGALDFAGGTVVHISSGVSALICALVIGKRLGFGSEDMRPHNLTYTALGAAMLWVGWFGFNAGSRLISDEMTANAFCVTHFAAAAGALAWAGIEWITRGKPSVLGAASGLVAGLVCITPASGYVTPMHSLLIGLAAGLVCYFACSFVKSKFKYDDSLDAFGVHGVGGTLGAVLTGVFATRAVYDANAGNVVGMLEGGSLMKGQLVAIGITWVFSIVVTFILLKLIDATIGLRVTKEDEVQGLDITQHGEEGYIFS
ncbi:MAG: ammonium transporter [Planctomycetes bacterium]|nr:ammonium transporter [Planctomycetota bacterium]